MIEWPDLKFPAINLWSAPRMESELDIFLIESRKNAEFLQIKINDILKNTNGWSELNESQQISILNIVINISKMFFGCNKLSEHFDIDLYKFYFEKIIYWAELGKGND